VKDLEDLDKDTAEAEMGDMKSAKVNVFLMATYGEGEPTDNASSFVKLLKGKGGDLDFTDVKYAVFGLGNTQYEFYNAMGKLVDGKIEERGGERLMELGVGDDDKSMEEDWEAWKEAFWGTMAPGDDAKRSRADSITDLKKAKQMFQYDKVASGSKPVIPPEAQQANSTRYYFDAHTDCVCTVNRELRDKSDGGSTKHIEVALPKGVKYNTADNAAVLPHNDKAMVGDVISALKMDANETFALKPNDGKHVFPTPCSVTDLVTKYTDINSPLRRADLKVLAAYCTDSLDRDVLTRLASKEGKAEYVSKIETPQVNFHFLVTKMIKSLNLTVAEFISVTSRLQPRYYTISSSSTKHPTSVHMTVSVIEGTNSASKRPFFGVCSKFLQEAANCTVFIKSSSFVLPKDNKVPIVMIGPGTGIAPMRALLQEREARGGGGENILYFGCKNRTQDYLYKDELEAFKDSGVLTKLYLAFSREQKEKVYVQNLMEQNEEELWSMIEAGAYFYVCGATNMGKSVVDVLKNIGDKKGKPDITREMSDKGRLVQELWA
jgi:NADPH-ferrihemoprotein reductase